jgi:hypothetical protein
LKLIVEGGRGGGGVLSVAVLSVAEGDSLADAEELEEDPGLATGEATMAGISFALFGVSFRARSTGGFGLGGAGTTTATEGVDTGLSL